MKWYESEDEADENANESGEFDPQSYFSEPIRITDVLDLHGFYPEQAAEVVNEFLQQATELKLSSVRIIHGKGRSKMKWTVHQFLKTHSAVVDFADALPEAGGWGATIVKLKTHK